MGGKGSFFVEVGMFGLPFFLDGGAEAGEKGVRLFFLTTVMLRVRYIRTAATLSTPTLPPTHQPTDRAAVKDLFLCAVIQTLS